MGAIKAMLCRVLLAASYLGAAIVLSSGVLKALDLNAFLLTLHSWETLPRWVAAVAAPVVPFGEIVLGGCFLAGVGRRRVSVLLAVLVAVLAAVFFREYSHNPDVSCGCFGRWSVRATSLTHPASKAILAGLLAGSFAWYAYAAGSDSMSAVGGRGRLEAAPTPRPRAAPRGLSLVEVLVCVAIIGIVMAVSIPALAGGRHTARRARALADLRSHCAGIQAYVIDARGVFPWFMSPREETTKIDVSGLPAPVEGRYFESSHFWHLVLAERYFSVRYSSDLFQPPDAPREVLAGGRLYAGYLYPCVFVALPDYWSYDRHRRPPDQWLATMDSMVKSPSAKIVVVSKWVPGPSGAPAEASFTQAPPAGFLDGSAAHLTPDDLTRSLRGHGGRGPDFAQHELPGMHTVLGVAGRDRK